MNDKCHQCPTFIPFIPTTSTTTVKDVKDLYDLGDVHLNWFHDAGVNLIDDSIQNADSSVLGLSPIINRDTSLSCLGNSASKVKCSTPRSISACLGIDVSVNSSGHAWTSSMETPARNPGSSALNQHSAQENGPKANILQINPESAAKFSFNLKATTSQQGIYVGDGALFLPDQFHNAGPDQFYKAFLTLDSVDEKLISRQWFNNHYKWILWKLTCTENKYSSFFGGQYLTVDNVMYQLKYRYDREIDSCHRSCLKKIVERDDTPMKTMVLCVSNIITFSTENNLEQPHVLYEVELTDGWYSISAIIDSHLSRMIDQAKVKIGHKLVIHGAQLVGSDQPCTPLNIPPDLKLKISSNSVRRAKWHAKLGFHRITKPFPISLKSVVQNGGNIPVLHVLISRVYPYLFMERLADNRTEVRVGKAEELIKIKHENMKQDYVEKIVAKVQAEHIQSTNKQKKKKKAIEYTKAKVKKLESKEDIADAFDSCNDPESFMSLLGPDQLRLLEEHRKSSMENQLTLLNTKIEKALQNGGSQPEFVLTRKVSSLLRLRIVGCGPSDMLKVTDCMLNVWNASDQIQSLLTEGSFLKVYNVSPSLSRKHSNNVLVANKMTRFEPIISPSAGQSALFIPRKLSFVSDMKPKQAAYNEVDLVFIIVDVISSSVVSQTVYVADAQLKIAALKFPGGPRVCGAEDLIKPKAILSALNLSVEPYMMHSGRVPCLLASNKTAISSKPRNAEYAKAISDLSNLSSNIDIIARAQQKLISFGTYQPNPLNTSLPISSCRTPSNIILNNTKAMSVDRSRLKMSKLRNYGCPPRLPPINSPVHNLAKQNFKPPLFTPPSANKSVMRRTSSPPMDID